jgi:hypothetical protein
MPREPAAPLSARTSVVGSLPGLDSVIGDLREVNDYLGKACKGVARGYYCPELPMLEEGIEDLHRVLIQLERLEVQFAVFRERHGMSEGGAP